jgi:coenzyme Q-binding protein COQ10
MTKFTVSRNLPFSVEQVFAIASDVAHYREFLPLVKKSTVANVTKLADGKTGFDAELTYAYKKLGISDTLRSHVVVDPAAHVVTATSSEGPVKSLVSEWKILPGAAGGADIHFDVDYTLQSRSLQFLLSGMFDMMVRRIMNAFEERARKLYGSVDA